MCVGCGLISCDLFVASGFSSCGFDFILYSSSSAFAGFCILELSRYEENSGSRWT